MANDLNHPQRVDVDRPIERDDDEFSLGDLIRSVWSARGWIVAGVVLAVLLAAFSLYGNRIRTFSNVTEYIIEFRFDGRNNDTYPNGTPFSLSDIIAPAVLAEVYENEGLDEYGLSFRQFQSAITIAPFAVGRSAYLAELEVDPRRTTAAEIREARDEFQRAFDTASRRYALMSFATGSLDIPQSKIAKVMIEVARQWEKNAIEVRGALKLDMRAVQPSFFDPSVTEGLEQLTGLRLVRDKLVELRGFVDRIGDLPGGDLVVDAETGYSVEGLLSLINRTSLRLLEVPAGWSRDAADDRSGALGMPINLYSARLFDSAEIQNLDYLIAIDLVRDRMRLVRDNVTRVLALPNGEVALDPETNLSARDVGRLLLDLDEFALKQLNAPVLSLGIAKNPEVVRLYYNSRLQELRREKDTLANKARVLEQANQTYQGITGGVGAVGAAAGAEALPGFPPGSSTVIPQFGDAFIDRLIELTQRGGDTQFRQDLLRQTVDLQQQATDIDAEIARIQEYINVFSANAGVERTAEERRLAEYFVQRLNEDLPGTIEKLRDYSQIIERIAYRLRFATDIVSVSVATPVAPTAVEGEEAPVALAPNVTADFYLRDVSVAGRATTADILVELRNYAVVANRLYAQIGREALGSYQRLFRSASDPSAVRVPMVNQREILVLMVAGIGGFLIALVAAFLMRLARRSQTGR